MQVRTITYLTFALILAASTPAAAQTFDVAACPELPVCGSCSADVKPSKPPKPNQAAPTIQSSPGKGDALTDGLLIIRYLHGAPAPAPRDVTTPGQEASDYLLKLDGVKGESKEKSKGKSNGGTLTLQGSSAPAPRATPARDVTTKGQGIVPEIPVCGSCGAETPKPTKPKKQSSFSFKFGGVGVSSGGVSVAAGDVTGDGKEGKHFPEARLVGRKGGRD